MTPKTLALGLTPGSITYTALGELPTATEKARCVAPAIAVTDETPERRSRVVLTYETPRLAGTS